MWLRVLSGADAGRTVELPEDRPFVLGRVQGCDLVIRDERASRQHAELRAEPGGGARVVDLGSANGTYVDGRRVEEALLAGGEELRIAGVELVVLARKPASEGGEPAAPTWSVVGRLVESRTRGARRATWVALGAAALALVTVAIVLLVGGGDDEQVPEVVRELAPATVLVEALRGDQRTATGSGWVLDERERAGGDDGARDQRGRALPRGGRRARRSRPSSSPTRRARTSRCCGCAASAGCSGRRWAPAPSFSRARPSSRSASRRARRRPTR